MNVNKLVKNLGFKDVSDFPFETYQKEIITDDNKFKIVVNKHKNDTSFTTYLIQDEQEIIIVNNTTNKFIEKMLKSFN